MEEIGNEIWKSIRDYETIYEVSTFGRVKSLRRKDRLGRSISEKILTPTVGRAGYPVVTLCNSGKEKKVYIHRLVAEGFINNSRSCPQVNHKDGNKTNNFIQNLEWVTPKEQIEHSIKMGLKRSALGTRNKKSKLSEDDVREIRNHIDAGTFSLRAIARKYRVCHRSIADIRDRKSWNHL